MSTGLAYPAERGAELMADVVDDLRHGRLRLSFVDRGDLQVDGVDLTAHTADVVANAVTVDVRAVHAQFMESEGVDIYEMRAAPPWGGAVLTHVTEHGNVWAISLTTLDASDYPEADRWQPTAPAVHVIDWAEVRWVLSATAYVGGIGNGQPVPTYGPVMVWQLAVRSDGTLVDVHWLQASALPVEQCDNALSVMLSTLNLCNCVNVTVADVAPSGSRAHRRRMERTGVRFSEIHVTPTARSSRGERRAVPLSELVGAHGVRGHFATYGSDGRGLLFGKLAGRYWIPPHVRGATDAGTVVQSYTVDPTT